MGALAPDVAAELMRWPLMVDRWVRLPGWQAILSRFTGSGGARQTGNV
jgi:hypothetical protein